MLEWARKVVLITGGSSGLGRALAEKFAECGAKVVISARGAQRLEGVVDAIQRAGGEVSHFVADVTDPRQVDALVSAVIQRHGQLDVLVNNVGRSMRRRIADTTPEDFCDLFEINFGSTVRTTRAALDHLELSAGSIVNIGSLASKTVAPNLGAYPATKFALAAYSAQLRLELASRGIHVLLVCPGPISRSDSGGRYDDQLNHLPESARRPGGGVRLAAIDPHVLAARILVALRKRKPELVVPWKARLLFAISQVFPRWGDALLRNRFE